MTKKTVITSTSDMKQSFRYIIIALQHNYPTSLTAQLVHLVISAWMSRRIMYWPQVFTRTTDIEDLKHSYIAYFKQYYEFLPPLMLHRRHSLNAFEPLGAPLPHLGPQDWGVSYGPLHLFCLSFGVFGAFWVLSGYPETWDICRQMSPFKQSVVYAFPV